MLDTRFMFSCKMSLPHRLCMLPLEILLFRDNKNQNLFESECVTAKATKNTSKP